jgi:hypothetical protein
MDTQIRRRNNRKAEAQERRRQQQNGRDTSAPRQQPPAAKSKRDWWRLDPNATSRHRPVEPPLTPDPDALPTRERVIFGWEARLTPIEEIVQDDVRRYFPHLHEWIVRRACKRAGLLPVEVPEVRHDSKAEPPDPGLKDIDEQFAADPCALSDGGEPGSGEHANSKEPEAEERPPQ